MNKYEFQPEKYKEDLLSIVVEVLDLQKFSIRKFEQILKKHPKDGNTVFSKDHVIRGIDWIIEEIQENKIPLSLFDTNDVELLVSKFQTIVSNIRMKPTRTISGVTTVTVLTKPFACPGKCIFCPNDIRMPKSYIASEPGAQRALFNRFSPYMQVYNRLKAYKSIGHPTEKIELIILGGTWSYYSEKYKLWFIYECFKAMNEFENNSEPIVQESSETTWRSGEGHDINETIRKSLGDKPYNQLIVSKEYKEQFGDRNIKDESAILSVDEGWEDLKKQQEINARGKTRCVGLVLETRSDVITSKETNMMRRLGATKVQLGIQTLDDEISDMNNRGETRSQVAEAFKLLRSAGFKIHGHIMPNLYGATPEKDLQIYKELFDSEDFKPDELKIYPTSIIKNTDLYKRWEEGKYIPYSTEQLINLLADCIEYTPEYCRLTRIIRDIPSTEIEGGNKTTNLREVAEYKLKKENRKNNNIRAREVKGKKLILQDLTLDIQEYSTSVSKEYFLQYITETREIAGFLRLSIPTFTKNPIASELDKCAMIREVHVYGPSLELNRNSEGQAQHLGLGTKLIEKAKELTKENGFNKLAVISAIGTREYYEKRGFELVDLYQVAGV